jgi:hypothetical protein
VRGAGCGPVRRGRGERLHPGADGAERSLRGKLVHAASNTSAAFKEKFGTEARKVEDESFDDNGVKLLKLEGLANPVPHSYVAEPRKEKAAQ